MRSKPWRVSDDTQSAITAMKVEGRRVMVPGKARWCWAMPMLKVGVTTRLSSPFSAAWAMISGHSQSVPSRPVGPCCSFEPIGTITVLDSRAPDFRRASISGQDDRWISMEKLRRTEGEGLGGGFTLIRLQGQLGRRLFPREGAHETPGGL